MKTLISRLILSDLIVLAIAVWPVIHFWGTQVFTALLAGFIVMSIAAIGTYKIAERGNDQNMNQFMMAVFGSMGIKLLALGAAIAVILFTELLHGLAFTLGVLISYLYKSVIEIQLLVQRINSQQPSGTNETNN